MDEDQLVDELQGIGFTEYQSRTYVAAVGIGTATPNDLAAASGVPQGRIYDVIDDLDGLGLLEVRESSGSKEVRAPPPGTVLEQFRERRMQEFGEKVESVSTALDQLHEYERGSEGFVTMVRHRESAVRHIRRAVEDADIFLTMALPVDIYESVADEVSAALDRGVTVRLILDGEEAAAVDPRPGRPGPAFPDRMAVRHRPSIDTFAFADRTYGIFNSNHPGEQPQPYIVTQERNLVLLFQNYAEQIWTGSGVVQESDTLPRRYLDPWRVIVDLSDRLTDERLQATVEGREIQSGRPGTWSGEVVDYEIGSPVAVDFHAAIPTMAALTVDTGSTTVTVGGWKATVEDVAADRIDISEPE